MKKNKMRAAFRILSLLGLPCCLLWAQEGSPKRSYMGHGAVHHQTDSATVFANDPRPLSQAIIAISEEYGWIVHFEEPPYQSDFELVDDTAPQWRAAHPNEKGVRIAAGGAFQSDYPEKPNTATSSIEEERVLTKIVSDYNQSGNPGKFLVRRQKDGSFTIIGSHVRDATGRDQPVSSVLDTPIDMPKETRSAWTTISLITRAIAERAAIKVVPGTMPTNLMMQSQVAVGGQNVPARDLLVQTLLETNRKLVWLLYYDPDRPMYALNVAIAQLALYDSSGKRTTIPIDQLPDRPALKPAAAPVRP